MSDYKKRAALTTTQGEMGIGVNSATSSMITPNVIAKKYSAIANVDDALESQSMTMVEMKNRYSVQETLLIVMAMIADVDESLHLNNRLSNENIKLIAEEIVHKYYYLKISDLYLFCRRVKIGYYGRYYERLGVPEMIGMLEQYAAEREQRAMQRGDERERKHNDQIQRSDLLKQMADLYFEKHEYRPKQSPMSEEDIEKEKQRQMKEFKERYGDQER